MNQFILPILAIALLGVCVIMMFRHHQHAADTEHHDRFEKQNQPTKVESEKHDMEQDHSCCH